MFPARQGALLLPGAPPVSPDSEWRNGISAHRPIRLPALLPAHVRQPAAYAARDDRVPGATASAGAWIHDFHGENRNGAHRSRYTGGFGESAGDDEGIGNR